MIKKQEALFIAIFIALLCLLPTTIYAVNVDKKQLREDKELNEIREDVKQLKSERDEARNSAGQWKETAYQFTGRYLKTLQELEEEKKRRTQDMRRRADDIRVELRELERQAGLDEKRTTQSSRGVPRDEHNNNNLSRGRINGEQHNGSNSEGKGKYLGEFEASAYNGAEFGSSGKTASGTQVCYGTVAVDRNVIALGTKLYIEGYGAGTALDVGSAIKGKRIDLWMDSVAKCNQFGRRTVKVYKIN